MSAFNLRYLLSGFVLLCVVALVMVAVFANASRGSGPHHTETGSDLAVLVGVGEIGSFLTRDQTAQLDQVLLAYQRGDFHDIYVAAPTSLHKGNRVPFAIAEYLLKGGLHASQIRIDDESDTYLKLFAKVARIVQDEAYSAPIVFADGLELPRTKLAGNKSRLVNAKYVSTQGIRVADYRQVTREIAAATSVYVFEPTPSNQSMAAADLPLNQDLLFKPLDQVSETTPLLAWRRVRLFENSTD